jgi:hypothetical protein
MRVRMIDTSYEMTMRCSVTGAVWCSVMSMSGGVVCRCRVREQLALRSRSRGHRRGMGEGRRR